MLVDYIIIQAGGKGTRLKHLTRNKPKGIVPVNNVPIIFNLFNRYPNKNFIIIGDYKHDVLDKYLEAFCKVKYVTVKADKVGTCAGVKDALKYIPKNTAFALIWSDLILGEAVDLNHCGEANLVGISKSFECRWSFLNNQFVEAPSTEQGVAGLFVFNKKEHLRDIPDGGGFVRWLGNSNIVFNEFSLQGTKEIGTLLALEENNIINYRCRPFNSLEIKDNVIIKRGLNEQGKKLGVREVNWYREVQKYHFDQIPKLYALDPLTMQKIEGENIFKTYLTVDEKKRVIDNLVSSLEKLHKFSKVEADLFSVLDAYYHKTIKRIECVRDLIPFAKQEFICINGRRCRNPYFYKDYLYKKVKEVLCDCDEFTLIHGDCTFSNIVVDKDLNVTFLDPRGYFGNCELYGDVDYDWAKLYYSIYGDYDQFNNKKFTLDILESEINLHIDTNGWKDTAEYFLEKIQKCNADKIRLIHAIIWLSLTTYAWEDYDSICGAFYKGTYLLEECL